MDGETALECSNLVLYIENEKVAELKIQLENEGKKINLKAEDEKDLQEGLEQLNGIAKNFKDKVAEKELNALLETQKAQCSKDYVN